MTPLDRDAPVSSPEPEATRLNNLKRLLSPRHVAVVGGHFAAVVIRQCRAIGYAGEIWPINPRRDSLEGLPCFRAVEDLPAAPDAAFVAVPAEATIEQVGRLAAIGAGGCVCYAAGFAETGGEGVALQRRLVEAAGDLALVGPNCYGLINVLDGAALYPDNHGCKPVLEGAAIVSQSGNIGINVTMQDRSLPLTHMISAGNQAVLGLGDYVMALAEDPRVTAIGLIMECVTDVEVFSRAAVRALERGVPIVALKCGRSAAGARVALSHTSSLAGEARLYDALFERLGIVAVDSLTKLIEALKLFALAGPVEIARFASLSCSGGEASLVADLAEDLGIAMPDLSAAQVAGLRAQLPGFVTVGNPLDYNTSIWGDRAAQERCFATVMREGFDAVALLLDYPCAGLDTEAYDASLEAFAAAAAGSPALGILIASFPELMPFAPRARAIEAGLVPLQGLEEAMTAIRGAIWYQRRRREITPESVVLRAPRPLAGEPKLLDEWRSKQLLGAQGLVLPTGRLLSPEQAKAGGAAAAADGLGYPVVAKLVGASLPHKTEVGAVRLGLRSADAVTAAVTDMMAAAAQRSIEIDGILIEAMIGDAVVELIVGVKRDERLGLALVIGSGGQLVELVGDSERLLLPADRAAVARALDRLRVAKLLDGFRGRPAGDRAAAIEAIMAVAAFAEATRDRLVELDINPLLVRPDGKGAVAVDVLVRMAAMGTRECSDGKD